MIDIKDKSKCCGCSACYNICPKNAIDMLEDANGFKYPVINKTKCINCDLCIKVCPIINNYETENKTKSYACINKDEEIRMQSSSGGIFTLIATEIINRKGIVFGVEFDEEFNLKHSYVEKAEDLEKYRGSKYLQSDIQDMYKKAKEFLDNDRYVLFTGTPCQIEGLNSYLQKPYDKLYTQDIICHGVPSPKVWRKYLNYRKEKDKEITEKVCFRNKDNGWKNYSIKISYKGNKSYSNTLGKDIFMKTFLRDVCLRDSCYNCSFKKHNRLSDITLADFWGIDKVISDMNDDKGTSLVIVNSKKGEDIFHSIEKRIIYKEVNINEAIRYNRSMVESVPENKKRIAFFENLDKMDFEELVKKYAPDSNIVQKCIKKLKEIIKKLFEIT